MYFIYPESLPDVVFDRAHRIGKPYMVDGVEKRSVIVRLTTFRHRTLLFYKRKDIFEKYGVWVRLDLTKQNYDSLKDAKEYVKGRNDIEYAYADINC